MSLETSRAELTAEGYALLDVTAGPVEAARLRILCLESGSRIPLSTPADDPSPEAIQRAALLELERLGLRVGEIWIEPVRPLH